MAALSSDEDEESDDVGTGRNDDEEFDTEATNSRMDIRNHWNPNANASRNLVDICKGGVAANLSLDTTASIGSTCSSTPTVRAIQRPTASRSNLGSSETGGTEDSQETQASPEPDSRRVERLQETLQRIHEPCDSLFIDSDFDKASESSVDLQPVPRSLAPGAHSRFEDSGDPVSPLHERGHSVSPASQPSRPESTVPQKRSS